MPRKPKVESVEDVEVKVDETPVTTGLKQEFVVCNSSGAPVRSYTLDLHGEKAEDLAKMFAGKIGGSVQ